MSDNMAKVIIDAHEALDAASVPTSDGGRELLPGDRIAFLAARAIRAEADAARLRRDAGRLADEVAVLVARKVIDSRSPAADALLDFRDPPASERADRLAVLDADAAAMRAALETMPLDHHDDCGNNDDECRPECPRLKRRAALTNPAGKAILEAARAVRETVKPFPDGDYGLTLLALRLLLERLGIEWIK